ncbi:ornithine aminotransferase [soil metagenome]
MHPTIEHEMRWSAHNYDPLPIVLVRGQGACVWDDKGNRYLDMMSAYSAVSHGHCHPRLVRMLAEQAARLAVVSRAFHSDRLGMFLERACELTGQERALPMNTGAEAIETAIKAARKWAYDVKGVVPEHAEIIAAEGNFHGRTITAVGMSSEPGYRRGFGPFADGFTLIPYGDPQALEDEMRPETAAFLVEPIQGESGIIVPPPGYLAECAAICRRHSVLLICDEIQTGLGRTGKLLAAEYDGVTPDGLVLGKALGGGLLPVSLFLARREVMRVFTPGNHGSTFGGNPLAAAVGREALDIIVEERLVERSATLGATFMEALRRIVSPVVHEIRGKGLFIGVEIDPARASARDICERLMARGILSKETHGTVVRLAPPLIIEPEQLEWAVEQIELVLREVEDGHLPRRDRQATG